MVIPTPSGWAGCSLQTAMIEISDLEGVDETTISLEVDGTVYNWPDAHLSWDGDSTLTFTPSSPYSNGYDVDVTLLYVEDIDGTPISGPVSWSYHTDFDKPYFYAASRIPIPDTTIAENSPVISIDVVDSMSGLPLGGLCMCIESADYHCPSDRLSGYCWEGTPQVTYVDSTFTLYTNPLGINFRDEDSVMVCLRKAVDAVPQIAEVCGPNWFDTLDTDQCWNFLVDRIGPRATLIYPDDGDTLGCDTLVVAFTDFSDIQINTCQFNLDGTLASEGTNPYVNGIGNTVYYTGTGTAEYYDEGLITVYVNRIRDAVNNMSSYFAGDFPAWHFTVDKTPPQASNPQPIDGGVASVTSPTISVQLDDPITGVLPDSITFIVDGSPYVLATTPGISWDGTRASFATGSAGLSWSDGDTVDVCIYATDRVRADRCGPNRMNPPYCWSFIIDISGPQAAIIDPPDASWSACEYQPVTIWLFDLAGIETSTIELVVNGFTYFGLDHMTFSDDTLIFTPTVPFVDGSTVNVSLNHAEDNFGHDLPSSVTSLFYMDMSPPVITAIDPPPDSVVSSSPVIDIDLTDAGIGVDETGAVMTVRGTPYAWPAYFSWDGTTLSFDLGATGESFSHGDTVQLCLHVPDLIDSDHCGPNELDSCWSMIFDQLGPTADMVYPPDSSITACATGEILIYAEDENGVDWTTAVLNIDGSPFSWPSPRLSSRGDTLVFTPASPFPHLDTVQVVLVALDDMVGNGLVGAPLSWFFVIDTEPPVMTGYSPGAGDAVSDPTPTIRIGLEDEPAGVDGASPRIRVEGMLFDVTHAAMSWDGSQITFDCGMAGFTFDDGDSVHVCMRDASDLVSSSLCGPNSVDFDSCWSFYVNLSGPVADLLIPLDRSFSACSLQLVVFSVTDDQGVIPESSTVEIEGTIYDWPDHLSWSNDSLTWTPIMPFADGDTIDVAVLDASDSLGNALSGVFEWWFISDQSPPVIAGISPPPGSVISDGTPSIDIMAVDSLSGEDPTTFAIRVNGDSFIGMSAWVWWLDPGFTLETSLSPYSWGDGDTARICIDSLADVVISDYCGPNIARPDSCWEYYIDLSGPQVSLVYPDSGVITACADSDIIIWLYDFWGVNPDSLRFWINGSTFDLTSPRLSYTNDTLRYSPATPFAHADTIEFRVSRAVDIAGNALTGIPTWESIIDTEPPELVSIDPAPGTVLSDATPVLTFGLSDEPAGVDSSTIVLGLEGIDYSITDAGVTYISATGELVFDAAAAGVSFGPGPLDVCIRASDRVAPEWCGPNAGTDSCYIYPYDLEGPNAVPIDPTDGEVTACEMVNIRILLTDNRGLEPDSVVLTVDGTPWTLADPELIYIGDSLLIFIPPAPYPEGVINVTLSAYDISGNPLSGGVLSYSFSVDLSPPVLSGETPAPGAVISTTTPTIAFDLTDSPAGVDEATIVFEVAGEIARTTDAGVTWDGTHFSLDPVAFGLTLDDGDSVRCCVSSSDDPDSCAPNSMGPECWTFHINQSGPNAGIIRPEDWWVTACNDQEIMLWVSDGNGVDESTIVLEVRGISYNTSDPELTYDGDSILTWTPSFIWAHAETVEVRLSTADDIYGTPLETPLLWHFVIDLEPPVIMSFEPPTSTSFTVADTLIEIAITDAPAGVNRSSLSMRIGSVYYSWPHAGLSWPGETLSFHFSDLGYYPMDGDSLEVCIELLSDDPDLCLPNELSVPECAVYFFDFRGPLASVFSPPESSWSSCPEQPIEIYVADANGVDTSTIELDIDGVLYTWPDAHLDYSSPYLTFTPDSPWPEGVMLPVSLTRADDFAGNPLEDAPLEFYFGLDTLSPSVSFTDPGPGMVVDPGLSTISAQITDVSSGVYSPLLTMVVNGTPFGLGHAALSWDGSSLSLDLTAAGITFVDGDSVHVCVDSLFDRAILCGPNIAPPHCWDFYVDGGAPIPELLWPPEGSIVSCPRETVIVTFHDPSNIEFDSLVVHVSGVDYTEAETEITIVDDSTFKFTPATNFAHGSMVMVQVLDIADVYGHCSGAGPVWDWTMDLKPPVADWFYPLPYSTAGFDSVSVRLTDIPAGVDPSSILLTVPGFGSYDLTEPALFFADSFLAFDPALAGLSYDDGDTATFCITAADLPDVCDPNVLPDTCWLFYVDAGGPVASVIMPPPGTVTSCADLGVRWTVTDPSGVMGSSINVRVNGAILDIGSGELTWAEPDLSFDPDVPALHGDTVRAAVIAAEDMTGNALSAGDTAGTFYIVDIEPPVLLSPFPSDGSVVADPSQPIWITATDFPAGVDTTSEVIRVDGTTYYYGDAGVYWDGDELHFDPSAAGITFGDGDTIEVCVLSLSDEPDTCAPNSLISPFCWEFSINLAGPVARIVEPRPNRWVACVPPEQEIILYITDPDGVLADSIRFEVEGVEYTNSDPELDYVDSVLTFTPSVAWVDGETIDVALLYVEDLIGNGLGAPLNWQFFIDLEPPFAGAPSPPDGAVLGVVPDISIPITDLGSGVDPSSLILNVDGTDYTLGSGLVWTGTEALLHSDSLISALVGTVSVCLEQAYDSPDYCGPNELVPPFCWTIVVDVSNPEAYTLMPGPGDWLACDSADQRVELYLFDDNGIVTDSITMRVDGILYSYPTGYMFYTDTILTFVPPSPWSDGDTVNVQLLRAPDSLGNPVVPFSYNFYIDLSPPELDNFDPPDGSRTSGVEPVISARIFDAGCGVDTSSIVVDIDGTDYFMGSDIGLQWHSADSTVEFISSDAGVSFADGDTVEVCVTASDAPDWCSPNEAYECWSFIVDQGGPLAFLASPDSNSCSACSLQGFDAIITDAAGIIASTIIFRVNGVPYTTDSTLVSYDSVFGLLSFDPSSHWSDGVLIHVDSFCVSDSVHNWGIDLLEFDIYIDLSPPVVFGFDPPSGGTAGSLTPDISFVVSDSGCGGVNPATIVFTVDSEVLTLDSTGVYTCGDTVVFVSEEYGSVFEDGDTVEVCVIEAADNVDYCDSNAISDPVCWSFIISTSGPVAEPISPLAGEWIACDSGYQELSISLSDPDGIADSTIVLTVEGFSYTTDSMELTYISADDSLFFIPGEPWSDGDIIDVELSSAEDVLGNGLASPLTYSFYIDLSPPETTFVHPVTGIPLHPGYASISVGIEDIGAGVVDSTLGISVGGIWHNSGDPGVSWDGDSLVYDGTVTFDTLIPGDTIDICVRGDDATTLCGPNVMLVCWEYTISADGPEAFYNYPPASGVVTSCIDSVVSVFIHDTDGDELDTTTFAVAINGTTYTDYPPIGPYIEGDSLLLIDYGVRDHGDTVFIEVIGCDDEWGTPLGSPLSFWFVIDTIGPIITDGFPPLDGTVSPGAPDMWFVCEDIPAGLSRTIGSIGIGSYTYSVGSGAIFDGDTLRLPSTVYSGDTVFADGDSVCLTITLYDSARYCGLNTNVIEWCFNIGNTPPVATLISPPDGAITSCDSGNIIVRIVDTDGLDSSSTGIFINGTSYTVATDSEAIYEADDSLLIFNALTPFAHGETLTCWVFAEDIYGAPLASVDTFTLIIDVHPPDASNLTPIPEASILDWEAAISIDLADVPAGVLDSMTMTFTTPRWIRTFAPGSTATSWNGTRFIMDVPAYNGGTPWTPSLDDELIFWHERETINVTVYAADSACCCSPNDSLYEWRFFILDDDSVGPEFADIAPTTVYAGVSVDVSATITDDPSGVYDDATGPGGQGVYVLWDSDGSLADGGEQTTQMSLLAGDTFISDSPIGPFSAGDSPIYVVLAYDNDFDFLDTADRALSISDTICPELVEAVGPVAELIYPADSSYTSCDSDRVIIRLTDPDGVNDATIVLVINGDTLTVGSRLLYSNDSLIWWPDTILTDGLQVDIELLAANDLLGFELDSVYRWTFWIDTSSPEIDIIHPQSDVIPHNEDAIVIWELTDNGAGIDDTTIFIYIEDDTLRPGDTGISFDGIQLVFDVETAGYSLDIPLLVCLSLCDLAQYCGPNCTDTSCIAFRRSKETPCDVWPIPFTPNADGANDIVWFEYPDMELDGATVEILDLDGRRVYSSYIPPTTQEQDAFWDGVRNNSKKAIPGTYIYIITRKDKVLCQGTLVLVR